MVSSALSLEKFAAALVRDAVMIVATIATTMTGPTVMIVEAAAVLEAAVVAGAEATEAQNGSKLPKLPLLLVPSKPSVVAMHLVPGLVQRVNELRLLLLALLASTA